MGRGIECLTSGGRWAIAGHLAALAQLGAPIPVEGNEVPADALRAVVGAEGADRVLVGRVAA